MSTPDKRCTSARSAKAESSKLKAAITEAYRAIGPETLRRIYLNAPETGKALMLLTNNLTLSAVTTTALGKARWQVEMFFTPVLSLS